MSIRRLLSDITLIGTHIRKLQSHMISLVFMGDIKLRIKNYKKTSGKKMLNSIVTLEKYVDDSCLVEELTSSYFIFNS